MVDHAEPERIQEQESQEGQPSESTPRPPAACGSRLPVVQDDLWCHGTQFAARPPGRRPESAGPWKPSGHPEYLVGVANSPFRGIARGWRSARGLEELLR